MTRKVKAVFSHGVLKPESPLDLEPEGRYLVLIESAAPRGDGRTLSKQESMRKLISLAVKTGVPDLAAHHDQYLYGTDQREAVG